MKFTSIFFLLLCYVMSLGELEAQEPVTLRLNLAPNIEYSMRLVADQNVTVVAKNKKETLTQSVAQDWTYDVREVRADGTTLLGCKIVAVSYSRQAPNGVVEWNSRDGKPAPEAVDYFSAFVGARFSLELDKSGRIGRVSGVSELTERIITLYGLSASSAASIRPLMNKTASGNTFKNIGNLMASFPDKPLQIGESWKKIDPISGDGGFDYDTTCSLQSLENGVATIGVKSKLVLQKNVPVASRNPFFAGATQSGTLLVDEKTGWTNNAQVVLRNMIKSPQGRIYVRSEMRLSQLESTQ